MIPTLQFIQMSLPINRNQIAYSYLVVVVKVCLGTRSPAFHQIGNATRAEHVKARQNPRNLELAVAKLATFLLVLSDEKVQGRIEIAD